MAAVNITPPQLTPKAIQLFWNRIDKTSGQGPHGDCWQWQGVTIQTGYGKVTIKRRQYTAHRLSFYLANGYWPDLHVCHSCDNPPYVNPIHLFLGTPHDNRQDSMAKGRTTAGERSSTAKLRNAQVLEIRALATKRIKRKIIARQFGVSESLVSMIVNRLIWKHI